MLSAYNAGEQVILVSASETGVFDVPVVDYFMKGKIFTVADDEVQLHDALADLDTNKPFVLIVAEDRKEEVSDAMIDIPGVMHYPIYMERDPKLAFYIFSNVSRGDAEPEPIRDD